MKWLFRNKQLPRRWLAAVFLGVWVFAGGSFALAMLPLIYLVQWIIDGVALADFVRAIGNEWRFLAIFFGLFGLYVAWGAMKEMLATHSGDVQECRSESSSSTPTLLSRMIKPDTTVPRNATRMERIGFGLWSFARGLCLLFVVSAFFAWLGTALKSSTITEVLTAAILFSAFAAIPSIAVWALGRGLLLLLARR